MPDNRGRYFDQATRDYHHAMRRNQRRRASSVAKWTVVPWLIVATVILAVFCFWMVLVPFAPPIPPHVVIQSIQPQQDLSILSWVR